MKRYKEQKQLSIFDHDSENTLLSKEDASITFTSSVPRLKTLKNNGKCEKSASEYLKNSSRSYFDFNNDKLSLIPSPWVRNGPPDQEAFHKKLIDIQVTSKSNFDIDFFVKRLSMVESVKDFGKTAQYELENPKPNAFSWNSNYGPHGWHRYIGRFPPHVVRALLNYFQADNSTTICDPFCGSGTTAVECRLLGIPFIGIEICPLSCLISRTKSKFPTNTKDIHKMISEYDAFYDDKWSHFIGHNGIDGLDISKIIMRQGNPVKAFPNIDKWFTAESLLGVSITVEFGMMQKGFKRDAILLALSSRMRSIGNVDVDVVRAEYSKKPRQNVNVSKLVISQLKKMARDIDSVNESHADLLGTANSIKIFEGSVLDIEIPEQSVDHIITSPPYGIEAISYLRTHLLSYRSLAAELMHDPYETRDKTIGSEYISDISLGKSQMVEKISPTFRSFFSEFKTDRDNKLLLRKDAMIQFFEDMMTLGQKFSCWLRDEGRLAFIIGNKKLGDIVIPTDSIIKEVFASSGIIYDEGIKHKLKTNNSNSKVPWQERVIQDESILLFHKEGRKV